MNEAGATRADSATALMSSAQQKRKREGGKARVSAPSPIDLLPTDILGTILEFLLFKTNMLDIVRRFKQETVDAARYPDQIQGGRYLRAMFEADEVQDQLAIDIQNVISAAACNRRWLKAARATVRLQMNSTSICRYVIYVKNLPQLFLSAVPALSALNIWTSVVRSEFADREGYPGFSFGQLCGLGSIGNGPVALMPPPAWMRWSRSFVAFMKNATPQEASMMTTQLRPSDFFYKMQGRDFLSISHCLGDKTKELDTEKEISVKKTSISL